MAQEYIIRFEMEEITGQTEEEYKAQRETNTEKSVDKKSVDVKTIGKVLTIGSAAVAMGSQIYQRKQSTNNSIRGDSIAQSQLDNKMAKLNEGLKVFGTVGIAAIVNPVAAVAAGGALAISYGFRAFQTAENNRLKQASWQTESLVNSEKQKRLVQNIVRR